MTADTETFGAPDRFQASLQWRDDEDPVELRPKMHGWSMASLKLTVAGVNLTSHQVGTEREDCLIWYTSPILHWLADNWVKLFHEESFGWLEDSTDAAATACNRAIGQFTKLDERSGSLLKHTLLWCQRHGLATASAGGLFPDIFIRRFGDDAEISWTASPPPFSPDGFTYEAAPGVARLPVADVAGPLIALLRWVRENPPELVTDAFRADWNNLVQKVDALADLQPTHFGVTELGETTFHRLQTSLNPKYRDALLTPEVDPSLLIVQQKSPAALMFGGLNVELSNSDFGFLLNRLVGSLNGGMSDSLVGLVEEAPLEGEPWDQGYDLADDLLDHLEEEGRDFAADGFVDVRSLCQHLEIDVDDEHLETNVIRGVAVAGKSHKPSILINHKSHYNANEQGCRFTIAHELCHILHDQSRARRLAHISGPWTTPAIEKRANAFAAWLLMPPRLLEQQAGLDASIEDETVGAAADALHVSAIALAEHLYNLKIIDQARRDHFRQLFAG